MTQPYLAFYTSDWRSDPLLRSCSFAARGLWIEMLSLMHEAIPYGYLCVGRRRITERDAGLLARQVGGEEAEVKRLLKELAENDVYSTAEDGTIVSRRMLRDAERRAILAANGRKGGRPKTPRNQLANQPDKLDTNQNGNQEHKQEPNLDSNLKPSPNAGAPIQTKVERENADADEGANGREGAGGRLDEEPLGDDELDLGKPALSEADRARMAPAMELGLWFATEAVKVGALPAHTEVEREAYQALEISERLLAVHPRPEIERRSRLLFARKTEPANTRLRRACSVATLAALWDDWFGPADQAAAAGNAPRKPSSRPAPGASPIPTIDLADLR